MKKIQDEWTMPKWMEPYREYIRNTGGNSIERMMNGNADPVVNLPLSTLQACVKSQVSLLMHLREKGYGFVKKDSAKTHEQLLREAIATEMAQYPAADQKIIEAIHRLAPKRTTGVYITSHGISWGQRTNARKFPENFFPLGGVTTVRDA